MRSDHRTGHRLTVQYTAHHQPARSPVGVYIVERERASLADNFCKQHMDDSGGKSSTV